MKYISFVLKSALSDFSRNKGRTFLTSLGILIGVLSVILLMALGLGLKKYISDQLNSLGANLIYVMPGNKKAIVQGGGMGGIRFDDKDVTKLKRIPGILVAVPVFAKSGTNIEARGNSEMIEMIASSEEIAQVMNLQLEMGRLLEKRDIEKKAKVALIGPSIATKIFGSSEEALGKNFSIEGQEYKVIGIYKSKGGGGIAGADMDAHVFVPRTAVIAFNPDKKYYAIYIKATDKDVIPMVKEEATKVLAKRYEEDQFSVLEQGEIMETVNSIFAVINTVLVAIAAISLVVGGIGIMNIMYVTVSERIREIGIRRALGAHKKDILYQFLLMSVFLSIFGGALGVILAFVIVFFLQGLFPAYIDLFSVLIALGVSSLIGIVFGVFPAKNAADLSPIDAIRYE